MYHRVRIHRKKHRRKHLLRAIGVAAGLLYLLVTGCWEVRDGEKTSFVFAPLHTVRDAARRAGVELNPLDICTAAGRQITVQRAPVIHLFRYGEQSLVSSGENTVQALLTRLGIQPGANDQVTPGMQTALSDGLEVRIDRVERGTEVSCAELPAETRYIQNPNLPLWQEVVRSPGAAGEVCITAEVEYLNGLECSRRILSRGVRREPSERVIELGTGAPEEDIPVVRGNYICLPDGQQLHFTGTLRVRVSGFSEAGASPGVAAADPRVLPYGTRMYIAAADGSWFYGMAQSRNFGRQVTGSNVEVYLPTVQECIDLGVRDCIVYLLG